jgi:hypothetical protein
MSVFSGPEIVNNGLVLYIDAANRNCYSGTGNTCISLGNVSITGNLSYLINGTTASTTSYSSNNGGVFLFGGTKDYIDCGATNIGIEASNKTMCAWIYQTSAKNVGIFDRDQDGSGGYGFWLNSSGKLWYWPAGFGDLTDNGPYSVVNNTWTHVAISYNTSTKTGVFYYNGLLSSTLVSTGTEVAPTSNVRINIGAIRNAGELAFGGNFFNGRMGPLSIYNRVLTQGEIQQNFEATRGRYNV